MKREKRAPNAQPEKKGSAAEMARLCVGLAVVNAACIGAQVRKEPEPEACPPGAVETMTEKLGLRIGAVNSVVLPGWREQKFVPVQEGPISIKVAGHWKAGADYFNRGGRVVLPSYTTLHGRLYFGEKRVYGRFIQARTPGGDTFPICMELEDVEGGRGIMIEPDGGDTIKLFTKAEVRIVDQFK